MSDELVARLRNAAKWFYSDRECSSSDLCDEAADRIDHLTAEIARRDAEIAALKTEIGCDIAAWSMRQAQSFRHTALDKVFSNAIREIEAWGAHPDLTSAQSLVGRAWSFINRWIETGADGASDKARSALSGIEA